MTAVVSAPFPLACQQSARANGSQCPGEKEYRSLSQGIPPQALRSPRKNMPTEARTAGETDRLSQCLWDAGFGFIPLALRPPSGDFKTGGSSC